MKKLILLLLTFCIFIGNPVNAQVSRLVNKVKNSVTNDVVAKPESDTKNMKQEPEPKCACDQPQLILDLGGNLKLMYSEITISFKDDGSMLVKDKITSDFYIIKDGVTQGPIKAGDPKLAGFDNIDDRDRPKETTKWANNEYISKSGEKFLIKFDGKSYGPYAQINEFHVTKSKEKFAAVVVENVAITEDEGKKMEEAIKNAKTDQEKMDLSMKYSQQMMQKMQQAGGAKGILPKTITNIPGVDFDALRAKGGTLNSNIKYDDILLTAFDKIIDLKGNTVLTLKQDAVGARDLFVNTANTKYAVYNYGTLTFSDGTIMSNMFNLHWIKVDGQVYLAYMYYSPKRNAIMQCKIQF
ncbi:MAG TPA: hypothetical protein VF346_04330 [Bacteroidales bacterium]